MVTEPARWLPGMKSSAPVSAGRSMPKIPGAGLRSWALAAGIGANDDEDDPMEPLLWPLALYFVMVVGLLGVILGVSYLLGESHRERATGEPYESGMVLTHSARIRVDVKFYLIAVFFVIFDLEALFIMAWAGAFREVGWSGYFEVLIFIGVLLAALVYLWKIGALDLRSAEPARQSDNRSNQRS